MFINNIYNGSPHDTADARADGIDGSGNPLAAAVDRLELPAGIDRVFGPAALGSRSSTDVQHFRHHEPWQQRERVGSQEGCRGGN